MALQVWLPLNGNIDNQGLRGDIIPQMMGNGVTFVDGKIGKAANFPNNPDSCLYMTGMELQTGTWCAWIKVLGEGAGASQRIISEGRDTGSIGTNIFVSKAGTTLSFTSHKKSIVVNNAITLNKWTHVAATFGNGKLTLYVNGSQVATTTYTEDSDYAQSQDKLVLGKMSYGWTYLTSYFPFNGQICDFRVYDNALSPREVKEISKGLVLHYPLAMPGQENIIANTSHEIACTYPASGFKDYYKVKTKSVPNETQYTLSFEAKSTVDGDHLRTHFYNPNTTTTCESSQGIIRTRSDGNMDFTLTTEWRRYWVVYTQTETTAIKSVICPRLCSPSYLSSQSGTGTVYVRNQKLERGSHPTPWIPNPADAEYSTLGFNDGIEYDVSGYNHNGTKYGTLTYSSDTPRYNTSTVFDGTTHVINNTSTIHLSNEFTISWWGKINTWRQVWEGMFLLQNTTALNSASGTYSIANAIHARTANKMTLTFRQGGTNYPFDHYEWTYTVGTWGHYACTYKDGVIIMYQNGIQTYTATIDNSSSGDYYYAIGKRVSNCNCQISDFRIYNTALSADDVLELYRTPISLTSNGTLMTQGEYVEV